MLNRASFFGCRIVYTHSALSEQYYYTKDCSIHIEKYEVREVPRSKGEAAARASGGRDIILLKSPVDWDKDRYEGRTSPKYGERKVGFTFDKKIQASNPYRNSNRPTYSPIFFSPRGLQASGIHHRKV